MKPEILKAPFKITKPGAYMMAVTMYQIDPTPGAALSQSIVKVLLDSSPAHARLEHPKLAPPLAADEEEPEKYDKSKAIGDAGHRILIGRGKEIAVGHFKSWQGKEPQAFKAKALADGKAIILAKHMTIAETMVAQTRAQLDYADFKDAFREGDGEVAIFAEEDGVWLKALIDWSEPGFCRLHDLKSTALSAHEAAIPNVLSDAEWGIQGAMQERILDAVDPANAGRRKFFFHLQENYPPFAMRSVELMEPALALGRRKVAAAIQIWRRCLTTGFWPAYSREIFYGTHTDWSESRWLQREIAMHDAGLIDFALDPVLGRVVESLAPKNVLRAG